MIDEKFSAASFMNLGLDSDESRQLADLLEQELGNEMRQVIETKFAEIIAKLNSMGHNLRLYGESAVGEVSYRDDNQTDGEYRCKLRVAFDYVTSSGYAHFSDS